MLLRFVRTSSAASASTSASRCFSAVSTPSSTGAENAPAAQKRGVLGRETLGKRLLSLVNPKRKAEVALRKWREEGRAIATFELNLAVRELRKLRRYKHALEICEWRVKQKDVELQAGDYALHLDLVAKVHGIKRAEKFFENILGPAANHHSLHSALLHSYVQNNLSAKAEALMAKMSESGLVKNPLPYNHMLSLYIANGQLEKVPELIRELKRTTSPNVVTYNMWLTFCLKRDDVETAEEIFSELKGAKLDPDWVTYSALANLYTKNGLRDKAVEALKELEKLASRRNRAAYSSLLTLRTNVEDKAGVRGVWRKMKVLFRKLNDAEYTCMISSLLKLDELKEAEELYAEWESISGTKDSRVANLLLAAYINGDKMGTAEEFYDQMARAGIKASYTTAELLACGYSKQGRVEEALRWFESALKSVAKWNPDEKFVHQVFSAVEDEGNVVGAEKLLDVLRGVGYVTTGVYNSVLRTYAQAGKMPLLVEERLTKDNVPMDDETRDLIRITNKMCVGEVPSDFLRR